MSHPSRSSQHSRMACCLQHPLSAMHKHSHTEASLTHHFGDRRFLNKLGRGMIFLIRCRSRNKFLALWNILLFVASKVINFW